MEYLQSRSVGDFVRSFDEGRPPPSISGYNLNYPNPLDEDEYETAPSKSPSAPPSSDGHHDFISPHFSMELSTEALMGPPHPSTSVCPWRLALLCSRFFLSLTRQTNLASTLSASLPLLPLSFLNFFPFVFSYFHQVRAIPTFSMSLHFMCHIPDLRVSCSSSSPSLLSCNSPATTDHPFSPKYSELL